MNSGNLPSKTTNILQERNPKIEIIGWKKVCFTDSSLNISQKKKGILLTSAYQSSSRNGKIWNLTDS